MRNLSVVIRLMQSMAKDGEYLVGKDVFKQGKLNQLKK